MWPFKKPKLNGNLIFLVAYRNSDYEMDISKEFAKTLTRKQIKMLNETCDIRREDLHCDTELLKEQEKQVEKYRIKEAADSKRKDEFDEKDHNLNGSPYDSDSEYAQFIKNNAGKMLLTEDEEKQVMEMLGNIAKQRDEIAEKISKLQKGTIWFDKEEMEDVMTEFLTKSATNNSKK